MYDGLCVHTELLRRSEEKREERYKERLQAYYKKNFKVRQLLCAASRYSFQRIHCSVK
jgi:hypothetical protein